MSVTDGSLLLTCSVAQKGTGWSELNNKRTVIDRRFAHNKTKNARCAEILEVLKKSPQIA